MNGQGNVRIDHEPEDEPAFHVPVTTACKADSNISNKRALGEVDTALVHVPEYSPVLPEIADRQAPFQDWSDLLADHPPRIRILALASWSVHVPVTPTLW